MQTLYEAMEKARAYARIAVGRLRSELLRLRGAAIGPKCQVENRVRVDRAWTLVTGRRCVFEEGVWIKAVSHTARVHLGDRVFLGRGVEIGVLAEVTIGNDSLVGPGVFMTDHNHGMRLGIPMNEQPCEPAPIAVGTDVWIGAGSILLPGAQLGNGSIIAAGSVVRGNVPAFRIYGGVPAREIGTRR